MIDLILTFVWLVCLTVTLFSGVIIVVAQGEPKLGPRDRVAAVWVLAGINLIVWGLYLLLWWLWR